MNVVVITFEKKKYISIKQAEVKVCLDAFKADYKPLWTIPPSRTMGNKVGKTPA